MATTSDNADITQPSKSKDQGMYVSLPNNELMDIHDIVKQVEQQHKPDGNKVNAKAISLFVKRILEPAPASQTVEPASQDTLSSIYDSLPEFPDMPIIAGNVASEIACKVVNEVDSHTTALSVLNVLQKFSWESKVALTVATFVLTFGDSGLNLTAESRTNTDKTPLFNEHEFEPTKNLIDAMVDATSCIVDFENLPTSFFTSEDPNIKNARTVFLVAVYLVVRAVVTAAAHNITMSSRGVNFCTLNRMELFDWATKLKRISDDELKNMLPELIKLLEEDVDMEAYNMVKEIVLKENHVDNIEVLNALISDNDKPQLYDCQAHKRVHLDELKGHDVLLLISDLDIHTYAVQCISRIASLDNSRYKVVWIPVDQTEAIDESIFTSQKEKMPGYSVDHPRVIKNPAIKFLKEEWEFKGDPIVVVLDPQGNVLHQNAMHMIYIWESEAVPFTKKTEETLWKEHKRIPSLLFDADTRQSEPFKDFKRRFFSLEIPMYCFIIGGDNQNLIQSFLSAADKVGQFENQKKDMIYVGGNEENYVEVIRWQQSGLPQEKEVKCYFWVRIESMISSLRNHTHVGDHAFVILQDLQRLLHYHKSNVDWVILVGSFSIVIGHGGVALSTLQEYELWKENASKKGFYAAFKSHYRKLYRQKFPYQRIEFPAPAKPVKTMVCPDCNAQMESYNSFLCYHPSSSRKNSGI